MNSFPSLALAGLATAFAGHSVQAQTVLYSDSFDRVEGSSPTNGEPDGPTANSSAWGTNDNALGGTVAQEWVVGPAGRGGGAQQVTDGDLAYTLNGGAAYTFDASTAAPLGFSVGFDFNRDPEGDGSGNGFLSVGLGAPSTTTTADIGSGLFVINNTDFSVLFQQGAGDNTGNTQFREDQTVFGDVNPGEGPVDYGDPNAEHSVLLTFVPQLAGAYGDAATIDGSLVVDGGPAYNFSVLGGDDFGTVSFASNQFIARAYDNVVVTALVPEPASLALLVLGGVGLLGRPRN